MFQTILNDFSGAVLTLLERSWNHPEVASLTISGIALVLLVWLHVPKRLEYYWQNGKVTIHPFNVRNEIPQYVRGRITVWRFCRQHRISLAFYRRIRLAFMEFFLKVVGVPDPCDFSWDGGFAAIQVYPLGYSRREYFSLCVAHRMWPWKRAKTLQRILDQNGGYLPGLQEATSLVSLVNRLYS